MNKQTALRNFYNQDFENLCKNIDKMTRKTIVCSLNKKRTNSITEN